MMVVEEARSNLPDTSMGAFKSMDPILKKDDQFSGKFKDVQFDQP